MSRKAQTAAPLDERARFANRARFLEEVSHGITRLLRGTGKNQAWLARRLDVSAPMISKILEGSHNFTLETLADIGLAFDRAAHLVWGARIDEMRFPEDEREDAEPATSLYIGQKVQPMNTVRVLRHDAPPVIYRQNGRYVEQVA